MQGRFRGAVCQRRRRDLELADGRVGVRATGRPFHRDADRAGDAHLPGDGANGPEHPAEAEDGEGQVGHRRTRVVQARRERQFKCNYEIPPPVASTELSKFMVSNVAFNDPIQHALLRLDRSKDHLEQPFMSYFLVAL